MEIRLPYGKSFLEAEIPDSRVGIVAEGTLETYTVEYDEQKLIDEALSHPIGSKPLEELARGKEKVVLIASDHTRPDPYCYRLSPGNDKRGTGGKIRVKDCGRRKNRNP